MQICIIIHSFLYSLRNSALNEKFVNFRTYDITEYVEPDTNLKQVVDYYIENTVEEYTMFIMRLTMVKGSTYIIYGYKHNEGYATAIVTGYFLDIPLYGSKKVGRLDLGSIPIT